ncbi:MAG: hypothetical protein MJB12_13495 [Firmicutes bacterium]|nr:hypothetical protein [Bacillota bacterium]
MDIYLSINNRAQVIKLPVIPAEFRIQSAMNNENYTTISQGDIKLIGLKGLKGLVIESFFPTKEYVFSRDDDYRGFQYVEMIEKWMEERIPIRLIISETPINMPCTIESFEYGVKPGSGDIYYTLTLSEFKFIALQQKQVE